MKIIFYHPTPLPVLTYGGTERIIFWHMKELARLGHHVHLIGDPKSKVEEYGIKLIPLRKNQNWEELIPKDADIIHLGFNHTVPGKIPTINTVHGNGKIGEVFSNNSVFVSRKHAENHGSNIFIYNALDLTEYPFIPTEKKWERFLFLAKASWRVKNLKQTVSACRSNNKHLEIAGGRWVGLSRYIHSHGIIGSEKKSQLIQKCDALIFPVRWHEPFGIAVIEAMAHGLPVIGSHYGSLPELITEETGILAHNYAELESIIKSAPRKFSSTIIRKYVENNFSIEKHTQDFLGLYQKIIKGEKLNLKAPTYKLPQRAEQLLPF